MRNPTYQFFSLKEYAQRLDALRSRMEQKNVDAMIVYTPENLLYLTGFQTPGYLVYNCLIVPMDREPVFVTRAGEAANIEPLTWVEDSRPWHDTEDWVEKTRDTLVDIGLGSKRIGIEFDAQPALIQDYLRLDATMSSATFVDCSGLVEQGRMIKSPQEIVYMKQGARAAEAAILAAIDTAEVGATENDVAAEMYRAQIRAGSEYTGFPIFVQAGARAALTHATWYRKRLEPNEVLHMEVPGCVHKYHAAKWAQIYLGDPPKEMLRAFEAAIEANKAARAFIKPGVTCGDVYEVAKKTAESFDMGKEPDMRVGYSIGLAFPPDWGEGHIISLHKGDNRVLQAGMTFHLTGTHAISLPGVWPTASGVKRYGGGAGGARCSDTILVTDNGCETLTNGLERKLYVK